MGRFSDDTALTAISENRWRANLVKGWRVGRVPNGGYVMAIIGRAISQSLGDSDPLSINAFYLEPTALGAVDSDRQIYQQSQYAKVDHHVYLVRHFFPSFCLI